MLDLKDPNDHFKMFDDLKKSVAILDPVAFAEAYLTIDGKPFRMTGNGWKWMTDLYREVAAQATSKTAKPMVILKGRQIGATVLAAVLSLYFTASGLYGTGPDKPPMRVLHAFPTLGVMGKYAKDKLNPMMQGSQGGFISKRSLKKDKTVGKDANDDTITEKTFIGFNKLRIDSVGKDADRLRGLSQDVILYDECFPHDQFVEVEGGKKRIGILYKMWAAGKELPRVKSYNEAEDRFEYKKITHAWERGPRPLIQITCGNKEIRCTENHRFLTENGWKPAKDLRPGDFLKTSAGTDLRIRALNDDQMQVALGSFLGDGHLGAHKTGRYRLSMTHGIQQADYCKWKISLFDGSTTFIEKNGYAGTPAVRGRTKCFGMSELPPNKTTCPQWVLDRLDVRGLAVWFMDDGAVNAQKNGAHISTCSFDEDSQQRIVKKLKESFGIESRYAAYDGYWSIYMKKEAYRKLSSLIAPYAHKNLQRKVFELANSDQQHYQWNKEFRSYSLTVVDKVQMTERVEKVYDIEVEDNHNFVLAPTGSATGSGGPIVHNCQDMAKLAIENSLRILTSAQYGPPTQGVQLYFGTPKNSGSFFWQIWEASDQRFFQPRCLKCDEHFFFYTIGSDEWKKIWVKGFDIRCPFCEHVQDKREAIERGRWQATKDSATCKYVGYHVNLILSPFFTKEVVMDYDPEINTNRSMRAWKNETLGEFYTSGGVPLELDDITWDMSRSIAKSVNESSDKIYTMGIDWGDKGDDELSVEEGGSERGQSYTSVAILSLDRRGTYTVENAFRLKKNDFTYKVEVISELWRLFKIRQCAADYMWGQDVVGHFQGALQYGDKFLGCINSGALAAKFSYKPNDLRVVLNKDLVLEDVFSMFKKGKIAFPGAKGSYDVLSWLQHHCCSMEVRTAQRYGSYVKKYVKGTSPNDGLMSIMYALVAAKFISSGGFKNAENAQKAHRPMPTLAYAPGLR